MFPTHVGMNRKKIGALCATADQPSFSFPDKFNSGLLILSGMVKPYMPALNSPLFLGSVSGG